MDTARELATPPAPGTPPLRRRTGGFVMLFQTGRGLTVRRERFPAGGTGPRAFTIGQLYFGTATRRRGLRIMLMEKMFQRPAKRTQGARYSPTVCRPRRAATRMAAVETNSFT